MLLDLLLVVCGYSASILMRFGGAVPEPFWRSFRGLLPLAVAVHLVSNCLFGLYGQMWRHASAAEARHAALSWASSTSVLILFDLVKAKRVPVSVVLLGSLLTAGAAGVVRFHSRLFAFQRRGLPSAPPTGLPTVVVGAGQAAAALVRDLQRNKVHGLRPVVALDDDLAKQGRFLSNIQVEGKIDDLARVVRRHGIERVLLAIPSGGPELVRKVALKAEGLGLPLKVLPPAGAFVHDESPARDVRDVRITDLLGREQVAVDLHAVCQILKGRRILITGAGGSIGSEIARQVGGCNPRSLLLLDHDETHLHDVATFLEETSPLLKVVPVLVDIREPEALERVFALHRPEVVFHAAAHKHVPLLEDHPSEAVLTNVVGTQNLLQVSANHGVERFVFISTDKAVRPSSVMGASKQVGEQLLLEGAPPGSPWCAVRFGNVLGSRGSVIPTFMRQ
ncbi:MAG: polysaccharide biosynthesis protein, partial [Acidimicrobiales bacterium]